MNVLLRTNLFLLFLVATFDPADHVTHLKVPLFVGLWVVTVLGLLFSRERGGQLADSLLIYVVIFAFVLPVGSILSFSVRGGHLPSYDGFAYFKSFLFVTLAVVLVVKKLDAIRPLCIVLTFLSGAIIVMTFLVYSSPELRQFLWLVGDVNGTFALSERNYAGLSYSYVYFHTSPLLVISLAYFTCRSVEATSKVRYFNIGLLLVNLVAMICSGPRNNIIFGLLTPLAVFVKYSGKREKLALFTLVVLGVALAATYGGDIVQAMFDPLGESNAIRLAHLHDYSVLFRNPVTLLFGQGLGSYFYSSAFGTETSITELTYLEFVRNFGLIVALAYFGLLLYPLARLRDTTFRECHYLILAYGMYLAICMSNPLLVSSSGMLVLAIVLANVFPAPRSRSNAVNQALKVRPQPE